jgi:hypothetical protein
MNCPVCHIVFSLPDGVTHIHRFREFNVSYRFDEIECFTVLHYEFEDAWANKNLTLSGLVYMDDDKFQALMLLK